MIESLNQLEGILSEHGLTLNYFVKTGVIDWRVQHHRDVFLLFDAKKRTGINTSEAVRQTADKFGITENAVYKIKKKMQPNEKEVHTKAG